MYKHLFGPVPSRRLGMSLGIDLIPHKICSLNCVYCECGATTRLTHERKEYVPVEEIYRELKDFFKKNPPIDFEYIHQGSSKQGFRYVIGKYTIEGSSFRVYILFKKNEDTYYVDTIDFTRE